MEAVNRLLRQLAPPAVANARREAADLQALVDAEGGGFRIAAWDWDFYAEKLRKARDAFDESQLKPYFELNGVLLDGVFYAAGRLYGLRFKERHNLTAGACTARSRRPRRWSWSGCRGRSPAERGRPGMGRIAITGSASFLDSRLARAGAPSGSADDGPH